MIVFQVWSFETKRCLHTLEGHSQRVYSLQFDGVHAVSGSLDASIIVWNVHQGKIAHILRGQLSHIRLLFSVYITRGAVVIMFLNTINYKQALIRRRLQVC